MTLLADLRGIFTRRRPASVDLTTTGPDGRPIHVESKMTALPPAGASSHHAEPINPPAVEEVVSLVRSISAHLDGQNERTDRLINTLERLPAAIEALPEIHRQNARLLEVVTEYLEHARLRDDALNETLSGITHASSRQTDVLGLLQQQLDANNRSSEALFGGIADFREAISQLAGSNARTTAVLSELASINQHRDAEITRVLARSQKWMTVAMVLCAAASVTAVTVAALSLLGG